ncbi:conserved protein of unknown function [Candidatus Filomicrobium marinum]|uniref:Uncharacterized protein n=2 Tax=Filomicrobium TaxID=119044 RepID=A0A0D6JAF5_9HYPH|nr:MULTISPECIES: hypothetical protein [Filomicrobium]MCV0368779.1 hypothetical protein [Filomicrobium sp.]CFW98685.1 conserved protein of unknown function [Candidatus Filomicrobium marinum]CPR14938.1 conserved protein of unknown function [Candidatus Filomicrobium marinum]SDO73191.1 hypothetical protein SAMN04488061_1508 [Filomicrobium insigne]
MPAPNPVRQRAARDKLAGLFAHPSSVFIIHYACQSFDAEEALGSPCVTAIAARHLESGETSVFSIHIEAELRRLGPIQVLSRIEELECAMLAKFFDFLATNRMMRFVHWNMRDAMYGFAAVEHRYRVLGREPFCLPESQKLDLARLLIDMYGSAYVERPYLEGLAIRNDLALQGFLSGPIEAEAFERGNYALVQRSVLAKVRLQFDILHLAHDRTLKTRANWWTLNTARLREAVELFEDNPVKALAGLGFAGLSAGFLVIWRLF